MKKNILIYIGLIAMGIGSGFEIYAAPKTKAKKAPSASEIYNAAMDAYYNYNFDEAEDLFEQYKELLNKSKSEPEVDVEEIEEMLMVASNALERVQQIEIIDSITLPRDTFFKSYKLASSAGRLGKASDFNLNGLEMDFEVSYLNQDKDYLITSVESPEGEYRLVSKRLLLDGTWETMDSLEGNFELNGNYNYPFLHGDGQTLYFANDATGTLGGYDIFLAQIDPLTGESLQPMNIGMPFNSPYDDFMMAIDEETGIGWWATDRNSPGEDVTIYIYILDEVRKNYPSDMPDLEDFAKILRIKDTWVEGKEDTYRKIKEIIEKL